MSQDELESFLKENKATEEDLVAAFETQAANFDTPPANASALVIEKLDFPDNLLPSAQAALQKQRVRTVVGPTTPEWKVVFLSAVAKTEADIPKVARALTEELNKLADIGILVGHLAPLSTVKLAMDHGTAVFIFPAVKWEFVPEHCQFAAYRGPLDLRLYVQEGEVGPVYE